MEIRINRLRINRSQPVAKFGQHEFYKVVIDFCILCGATPSEIWYENQTQPFTLFNLLSIFMNCTKSLIRRKISICIFETTFLLSMKYFMWVNNILPSATNSWMNLKYTNEKVLYLTWSWRSWFRYTGWEWLINTDIGLIRTYYFQLLVRFLLFYVWNARLIWILLNSKQNLAKESLRITVTVLDLYLKPLMISFYIFLHLMALLRSSKATITQKFEIFNL